MEQLRSTLTEVNAMLREGLISDAEVRRVLSNRHYCPASQVSWRGEGADCQDCRACWFEMRAMMWHAGGGAQGAGLRAQVEDRGA